MVDTIATETQPKQIQLQLKRPFILWRVLEKYGLREMKPWDITPNRAMTEVLYRKFPDIGGDRGIIDTGLGGECQDWRFYKGWWKELVSTYTPKYTTESLKNIPFLQKIRRHSGTI